MRYYKKGEMDKEPTHVKFGTILIIYVHIYVYVYVCIYVCLYIYIYMCIYIYWIWALRVFRPPKSLVKVHVPMFK